MGDNDVITVLSSDDESPTASKRPKPMYVGSVSITPIKKDPSKEKVYSEEDIVVISDDINTSLLKNIRITTVKVSKKKAETKREDVVILSDEESELNEKEKNHEEQLTTVQNKKRKFNNSVKQNIDDQDCEIIIESDSEQTSDKENNVTMVTSCEAKVENGNNTFIQKSNDGDCEIISESDSEKSSCKENIAKSSSSEEIELDTNSTKSSMEQTPEGNKPIKNQPCNSLLETFLQVCENSVKDTKYIVIVNKFPILRKLYKKCDYELIQSRTFQKIVEENTKRAEKSAAKAIISFREIYQHTKDVVEAASIEVSEEHRSKLKKLEKTIRALLKRIKRLEEMEVDFDDEEDSSFMQLTRYTERLNKVYHKYCELMKKNPYSGRLTYAKLDFADSEFNEINRAISKKYKNRKFPSYVEMQNFIKQVVEENNLYLTEAKIKSESIHCFNKLGELMQSRRKKELYDSHYMYIRDVEDPADKDTSLYSTLRESYKEGLSKIEKVCQEYVIKEELGEQGDEDAEEELDKSDYVDSEEENDTSPQTKDKVDEETNEHTETK